MSAVLQGLHVVAPEQRVSPIAKIGISVFDVDRTLTRQPTYSAFLIGTAWAYAPWRLLLLPLLMPFALLYALKLLPRQRMKEAMQLIALGGRMPGHIVAAAADRFARGLVSQGLYAEAVALVAAERDAGRRVVLATAAPHFYAAALARQMGIADVVATRSIWRDGSLTARIDGENCHGPAKQRALAAFLEKVVADRDTAHVRFFTDDASDLPTLLWSDEAVAVNPSAKLRAQAAAHGWPIHDWRKRRGGAVR